MSPTIHLSADPPNAPGAGLSKIKFNTGTVSEAVEARWKRPLHANGTGATHCKTFTGKLTPSGLEWLDKHINEWLDQHPEAEVKFATTTIGVMDTTTGKETAIVVQVWI